MLNLLAPVASLLGLEAEAMLDRVKQNGLLWAAIALFALIALSFALVAANTAATLWLGPIWGPLLIAGAAALIALILYIAGRITARIAHRREAERRRSSETTALVTTATLAAVPMLLRSPLIKRVGLPLGGALAALFVLMKSSPGAAEKDEN